MGRSRRAQGRERGGVEWPDLGQRRFASALSFAYPVGQVGGIARTIYAGIERTIPHLR